MKINTVNMVMLTGLLGCIYALTLPTLGILQCLLITLSTSIFIITTAVLNYPE